MIPSTSYVGASWVVGREVSKQPPWSIATSTSTLRGRIVASIGRVTSLGALAPGMSTAPTTTSAASSSSSIVATLENRVRTRPPNSSSSWRRRGSDRSSTDTSQPRPTAMRAACVPTTPPPSTTTRAAGTPGTPPSRRPLPPAGLRSAKAAASMASRPATSLIGASSGSPPRSSVTVS